MHAGSSPAFMSLAMLCDDGRLSISCQSSSIPMDSASALSLPAAKGAQEEEGAEAAGDLLSSVESLSTLTMSNTWHEETTSWNWEKKVKKRLRLVKVTNRSYDE